MRVGSLVQTRWEDTRLGLIHKVVTFPHRENIYFVQFGDGGGISVENQWYDESDLKLVEDDK